MQDDILSCGLDEKLKNKNRESKIKLIFSSKGLVEGSMNYNRNESPEKLITKITNKEFNLTMYETNLTLQDNKKFRKNSCHTFHNKSGFYMI